MNTIKGDCMQNSNYVNLEIGEMATDGINCAFLWFVSSDHVSCHKSDTSAKVVMLAHRWDGKFGTFGGKCEPGETPITGLIRELDEEFYVGVSHRLPFDQIKPLSCLLDTTNGNVIHSFVLEMKYYELLELNRNFLNTTLTFKREICGLSMFPMANYNKDSRITGVCDLMKNQFSGSGKIELQELFEMVGLEYAHVKVRGND